MAVAVGLAIVIAIEQVLSTRGGEVEAPEWEPPIEPETIPPPGEAWPPQRPPQPPPRCGR